MNSVFKKLKFVQEGSGKKTFAELNILKTKSLQAINQILQKRKSPDTYDLYNFAERTCVYISK